MGILYQIVKCLRQYAHRRYRVKERCVGSMQEPFNVQHLSSINQDQFLSSDFVCEVSGFIFCYICFRGTIKSREHGLQTLLYFIQMISSYVLMLIIMTFNAWVFVSAVAGLGLGYFLCGWAYPESDDKITCPDLCSSEKTHCHGNGDTEQELKLLPSPSAAECEECSI